MTTKQCTQIFTDSVIVCICLHCFVAMFDTERWLNMAIWPLAEQWGFWG